MENKIEIKRGDRIIIKNVPDHYSFKNLYEGLGVVDVVENGKIGFFTGHIPYKKENTFSCSGCGNTANINDLKFIENKPAQYWKFKNDIWQADNAEYYEENANYFEIDFYILTGQKKEVPKGNETTSRSHRRQVRLDKAIRRDAARVRRTGRVMYC